MWKTRIIKLPMPQLLRLSLDRYRVEYNHHNTHLVMEHIIDIAKSTACNMDCNIYSYHNPTAGAMSDTEFYAMLDANLAPMTELLLKHNELYNEHYVEKANANYIQVRSISHNSHSNG